MKKGILLSLLMLCSFGSYALPFTIVPKDGTQLPTSVHFGNTATAYYTVKNNTQSQRNNNYIKWLPPSVTQVVSNGTFPDTCGNTFNLAKKGQEHDSCTLQLTVAAGVSSNAPSPHDHLFVCFPGGETCAGTNYSLNVTLLPAYVYTTNESTNTINQCPLQADGAVSTCTDLGNPGMNLNGPTGITLNKAGTQAYIANGLFSSNTTVSLCSIATSGAVSNCNNSGSNIFNKPSSITLNSTGTIAYVTNTQLDANPAISQCPILDDGSLGSCINAGDGVAFDGPFGIAFNNDGASVYVTNYNSGNVLFCTVNLDGTFSDCLDTDYNCNDQLGSIPYGIALNPAGTIAYIVDGSAAGLILACPIELDGKFDICVNAASGLASNYFNNGAIRLNSAGTIAYIAGAENSNIIYSCPISNDGITFDVSKCTTVNGSGNVYGLALD